MSVRPAINATQTAERLRDWATGNPPIAAAVELLIRAFSGRFAHPNQPWVRVEANGYVWLDDEVLHANLKPLSGGERRVLDIVCALIEPNRCLRLADTLTGLDRHHLDLVLAAFAHAAGSYEHAELNVSPETHHGRIEPPESAHPWPPRAIPAPSGSALQTATPPNSAI